MSFAGAGCRSNDVPHVIRKAAAVSSCRPQRVMGNPIESGIALWSYEMSKLPSNALQVVQIDMSSEANAMLLELTPPPPIGITQPSHSHVWHVLCSRCIEWNASLPKCQIWQKHFSLLPLSSKLCHIMVVALCPMHRRKSIAAQVSHLAETFFAFFASIFKVVSHYGRSRTCLYFAIHKSRPKVRGL